MDGVDVSRVKQNGERSDGFFYSTETVLLNHELTLGPVAHIAMDISRQVPQRRYSCRMQTYGDVFRKVIWWTLRKATQYNNSSPIYTHLHCIDGLDSSTQ